MFLNNGLDRPVNPIADGIPDQLVLIAEQIVNMKIVRGIVHHISVSSKP